MEVRIAPGFDIHLNKYFFEVTKINIEKDKSCHNHIIITGKCFGKRRYNSTRNDICVNSVFKKSKSAVSETTLMDCLPPTSIINVTFSHQTRQVNNKILLFYYLIYKKLKMFQNILI